MLIDSIKQFNWLDICILVLFVRICFVSARDGMPAEFFKFCGTIAAIFLALHSYKYLSVVLQGDIPYLKEAGPNVADVLSLLCLSITGYLSFLLLRIVFCRCIKMEAIPNLNRWGGLIIGVIRAVMLSGLIIFMMVVSDIPYLRASVKYSYFGAYLFKTAPKTYSLIWNNLASKFTKAQNFNAAVFKVKEGMRK